MTNGVNQLVIIPTTIQAMLSDFTDIMQEAYKDSLYQILLFGSYARGEANDESDIDIIVILDKSEMNITSEINKIVEYSFDLDLEYGKTLCALPMSLDYWDTEESFFLDEVRKDGFLIWTNVSERKFD